MADLIITLDETLKTRLQERAVYSGRSLSEEARTILHDVLSENPEEPLNLAARIHNRFAEFDFELPHIPRK